VVDCGTNNYLGIFARADRPPYGRDFDTGRPTGRFCSGRIPFGFLGRFLCFEHFPLFLCFGGFCLVAESVVEEISRSGDFASEC
ncbi:unnamed protein product, partial [Linum tenue]